MVEVRDLITSFDPVDDDMRQSASLLIAEGGRFLVAARPPVSTYGRTLVELTGVGGWVEEGESFSEAVQRESIEETGSAVSLIDLHETLVIHSPDDMERVCLVG